MADLQSEDIYDEREQTLVKHEILRNYLLPFALIIGQRHSSITYVDCFSGPWQSRAEDYSDTSFGIAIEQLKAARSQVASMGKSRPRLRAFFIEQDKSAYARLEAYLATVTDIEIVSRNCRFEDCVGDIMRFIAGDPNTFPFFLIDPKGWTIPLDTIRPLLMATPGESLIMFMTEYIRRFMNHPDKGVRDGFDAMYGEAGIAAKFASLSGQERDFALLSEYQSRVQKAGNFEYCSAATVLNPRKDRTHFNLVYLTRHQRGIEKFKDSERRAMKVMEETRAAISQKAYQEQGQISFFEPSEMGESKYYVSLRNSSLQRLDQAIDDFLKKDALVSYDTVWDAAMRLPLIWPTDVSYRVTALAKTGCIEVLGLAPGTRVPKKGNGQQLRVRP